MNVKGIDPESTTLRLYFLIAAPLTAAIVWVFIAFQMESFLWPVHGYDFVRSSISSVMGKRGRNVTHRHQSSIA